MTAERKPLDKALDLFIYAPVGATIEFWERLPGLAEVGRERIAARTPSAKAVGQFAVTRGVSSVTARFGKVAKLGRDALDQAKPASENISESVPIADYDNLTAAVIVPLLASLDTGQRGTVRARELAGRGRRTILARLDQLDSAEIEPAT